MEIRRRRAVRIGGIQISGDRNTKMMGVETVQRKNDDQSQESVGNGKSDM